MPASHPWWRGARGEWYVIVQAGLLALVGFGPTTGLGLAPWGPPVLWVSLGLGLILAGAGGLLALAGLLHLGPNLTAGPPPASQRRRGPGGGRRLQPGPASDL